jgi:hypothetical protein
MGYLFTISILISIKQIIIHILNLLIMTNLQKAVKNYPVGTQFYSATGNLRIPLQVPTNLKYGKNKKDIVAGSYGLIYDAEQNSWAQKVIN